MPWSMALRIRCTSGSARHSIMVLSSSVSSPVVTNSTGFDRSRDRSWIRRRKRPNSEPIGTMRAPIVVSRKDEARRSISSAIILIDRSEPEAASWVSRAWAITSSPTRSISSSRRSAWTRTVAMPRSSRLASALASGFASSFASGFATGFGSTFAAGSTATGAATASTTGAGVSATGSSSRSWNSGIGAGASTCSSGESVSFISSETNMKTSSIAALSQAACSLTSHFR